MSCYSHPAARSLAALGALGTLPAAKPALDACKDDGEKKMDAAGAAADFALSDVRAAAIAAVQTWASTDADALDDGETLADRLDALMVGVADSNQDGEISEDEAAVIDVAMNAAWDYLAAKGVSEDDISALLNDGDDAAAVRVAELLSAEIPSDEAEAMADIDNFVFDADSQESVLDSAAMSLDGILNLDATYKKAWAVRGGKKVRINKRISGTVKLSAKQKVAIRKAQAKTHSAGARVARMKSIRMRAKMGLGKK